MDNKALYLHYSDSKSNEVLMEFEYTYSDSVTYFYSFLRPIDESLDVVFKKVIGKISKIKYRKCTKKNKNHPTVDNCEVKIVDSITKCELETSQLTVQNLLSSQISVKINETLYTAYINPPWIKHCQLPKILMVNCPIYPLIDSVNAENEMFNYNWYKAKSKTSNEWIKCHSGLLFIPSHEYENFFIKLEVTSCINISQQVFKVISTHPVEKLPQTSYQLAMQLDNINIADSEQTFKMCTYNILSYIYGDTPQAKKVLYRHCDSKFLLHDYRQCLILNELIKQQSDLIFLQEVDQSFYLRTLFPILKLHNYNGIYQIKSKNNFEGQAIFWKTNKFQLIKNISIQNLSIEIESNKEKYNKMLTILQRSNLLEKWQSMGQCMTGCVLETVDLSERKQLVLSNSHLFFHPEYELFRLFQIAIILYRIEEIKQEFIDACCIIGGDFNASFEDESIKFIFNNEIEFKYNNESFKLQHSISNLQSVHKDVVQFTNYTPDYVGVLDHIIIENSGIKIKNACRTPSQTDILQNTALPNKFHPSDHLPLYCELSFL